MDNKILQNKFAQITVQESIVKLPQAGKPL